MTDCTLSKIEFPRCCRRVVQADFSGGDISSNGGVMLLAAADRRLGLLSALARRLHDHRPGRHHPLKAAQDRRRGDPQHKACHLASLHGLSRQGFVQPGRRTTETRIDRRHGHRQSPSPRQIAPPAIPSGRAEEAKTAPQTAKINKHKRSPTQSANAPAKKNPNHLKLLH